MLSRRSETSRPAARDRQAEENFRIVQERYAGGRGIQVEVGCPDGLTRGASTRCRRSPITKRPWRCGSRRPAGPMSGRGGVWALVGWNSDGRRGGRGMGEYRGGDPCSWGRCVRAGGPRGRLPVWPGGGKASRAYALAPQNALPARSGRHRPPFESLPLRHREPRDPEPDPCYAVAAPCIRTIISATSRRSRGRELRL